jgi:hypothetical protein
MKKILLVFILFSASFNLIQAQSTDMLIGKFDRAAFMEAPYQDWFAGEYEDYQGAQAILNQIELSDDLSVKVFLGTWCSDSRREVPRFLKIWDELGQDTTRMELIGLDREKKAPGVDFVKWGIDFVPTFIFMKGDREIGRIIETPIKSLEEDFLDIISQK